MRSGFDPSNLTYMRRALAPGRIIRAIEVSMEDGSPLMCIPDYLAAPYLPTMLLYAYQDHRFWNMGILEKHRYKWLAIHKAPGLIDE